MNNSGVKVRSHTGCSCYYCRKGRNSVVRREFQRKMRHLHKKELKNKGEIVNVHLSIGYTD